MSQDFESGSADAATLDVPRRVQGEKHGKVITLVLEKGGERKVFRVHKERVVIGSVVSADVKLSGEGVAPIHAVLELAGKSGSSEGEATIYDLASESGVFVNNQKVIAQSIESGDRLRFGSNELEFNVDELVNIIQREPTRETEGRRLFLDPEEDFSPLLLEDERGIRPIFNYRATQERALEVVMSWRETILDVEHFVKQKAITVGSSIKSDFGIPPVLEQGKTGRAASRYPMLSRVGAEFVLNIDPRMRGVIQRQGRLETLDELRNSIRSSGNGSQLSLGSDDFAKISLGEVDFYLSYTSAPPRLKKRQLFERDPLFLKVFLGSMAMTGAIIGTLLNMNVNQTVDAEQIPERLATILYQPEKYVDRPKIRVEHSEPVPQPKETPPQPRKEARKPEPKPKPVPTPTATVKLEPHHILKPKPIPKEMNVANTPKHAPPKPVQSRPQGSAHHQNVAKEGEGARHSGKEGTRGSRKAAPVSGATHQDKAMRPSAEGGKGAGGGHSQAHDIGNVDMLKEATGKIQDILGNAGAQLGKGGERLKGFGGFTTQGNGGLALSGSGAGGGGASDLSQGLGNKGRGGGKIGTGMGAAGSGTGIIGGRTRVALRTGGPEETVVTGSVDPDAILMAILAHKDEFRLCYEREINAETPNISGTVSTTFVIGATGRVTQAGVSGSSLHNANVERCVLNVIRRIEFPLPRGSGVVQVSYPFKFAAEK